MKKITITLLLISLMSSCGFLNKEGTAIEICQNSKFPAAEDYGFSEEYTYLDFANLIVQNDPNEKYDWDASETEIKGVFLVNFSDENGSGHRWEVTIDEQIVKHININDYLSRKYGFSKMSNSDGFFVSWAKTDTLKVITRKYRGATPEIIYEYHGAVVNNTDKIITSAHIKGNLNLIFEEKTIQGEAKGGLFSDNGFIKSISENKAWRPGEEREFKLKTSAIDIMYAGYIPPYVLFEICLEAEDPIGYSFDANILEIDLKEKWQNIKLKTK